MNIYLIVGTATEDSHVRSIFSDCYSVRSGVWAVATELETCAEVSSAMGFDKNNTGIAFRLSEYYGVYDKALWQLIEAWDARP